MCKLAYVVEVNPDSQIGKNTLGKKLVGIKIGPSEEAIKADIHEIYANKKVFTSIHFTKLS
jgi:hypothetical protein